MRDGESVKRVLVVCTGNTCRSVMAEALLKHLAEQSGLTLKVDSAGIGAFGGDPPTPAVEEIMREYGLDVSQHRSQVLQLGQLQEYDLILTMTRSQRDAILEAEPAAAGKVFLLQDPALPAAAGQTAHRSADNDSAPGAELDIADPFGRSAESYRQTAEQLEAAIRRILTANPDLVLPTQEGTE